MIWLAISLIICTLLICSTIVIIYWDRVAYANAVATLVELCDKLNEIFPDSNLHVTTSNKGIKVEGELKYLKKE